MNWYRELRWKISQSECKSGYFDEPIEVSYVDDSGEVKNALCDAVDLKGDKIITEGNRCPQIHVTDETTLEKMYRAFKPSRWG